MTRVGVITGLAAESACVLGRHDGKSNLLVACAGADAERAGEAARRLIGEGCKALVGFGVAGGLASDLAPGAVVVADGVVTPDGRRLEVDEHWRQRLGCRISARIGARGGTIVTVVDAVTDSACKRMLAARTGSVAVDMESYAIVQVATGAGVPVLIVRAIADPLDRALPAWLPITIRRDGTTDLAVVAKQLSRRPWEIAQLIRVGLDFRRGLSALRRVAADAGPLFHFTR
ncbi:MAG: phosphorylase [Rhodospirillales bacterium]|nr:phosphorylase [Rhodospirillales bacterium]